jgi:restriction endonuclease S subunit
LASFEHVTLESIAEVTKGGAIRRDDAGDIPFIGPGAIRPLDVELVPDDRTNEAEIGRFPKATASEGDIVVNGLSTYIAAAALIEEGGHPINRHVFRIRADRTRVLPAYLAIAINSRYVRDSLRNDASGSIMKMLTLPMLRKTLIPLPPLSVQMEIMQRVSAAKGERDIAADSLRLRERALSALVDELGSGEAA